MHAAGGASDQGQEGDALVVSVVSSIFPYFFSCAVFQNLVNLKRVRIVQASVQLGLLTTSMSVVCEAKVSHKGQGPSGMLVCVSVYLDQSFGAPCVTEIENVTELRTPVFF